MRARRVPVLVALGAAALAAAVAAAAGAIGSGGGEGRLARRPLGPGRGDGERLPLPLRGDLAAAQPAADGGRADRPRRRPRRPLVVPARRLGDPGRQLPTATGAGLSADEGTLVLAAIANGDYGRWPRLTRLAVLDTQVHLRHPTPMECGAPTRCDGSRCTASSKLAAVSPDGSDRLPGGTLHPDRPGQPPGPPIGFQVRALDLASGRLSPAPPHPRRRPGSSARHRSTASPAATAAGPTASTSTKTNEVFVLAIDTVARPPSPASTCRAALRQPTVRVGAAGAAATAAAARLPPTTSAARGHSPPLATVPLPIAGRRRTARRRRATGAARLPLHPGPRRQPGRPGGRRRPLRRRARDRGAAMGRPGAPGARRLRLHPRRRVRRQRAEAELRPQRRLSRPRRQHRRRPQSRPRRPRRRHPPQRRRRRPQPQLRRLLAADRPARGPAVLRAASLLGAGIAARGTAGPRPRAAGHDLVPPAPRAAPAFVRAWGQSAPAGRRFAHRAGDPLPPAALARRDRAELAEPSLPGHQLLRRRAAAGAARRRSSPDA